MNAGFGYPANFGAANGCSRYALDSQVTPEALQATLREGAENMIDDLEKSQEAFKEQLEMRRRRIQQPREPEQGKGPDAANRSRSPKAKA